MKSRLTAARAETIAGAGAGCGRASALALVLALSGCAVGPDYKKPDSPVPAQFSAEAPWEVARPQDGLAKGSWWLLFGDANLNQLEASALEQSQTLKAAAFRLSGARQQITVARADLFPTIGVQAGDNRERNSVNRPQLANAANISTLQNDFTTGITVSYEPDLFGRVRRSVESAEANAEEARADLENTRLLVTSELAADYYNLRELDIEIKVVNESIDSQQRALDYVTNRHDLGVASGLDLAQQQAQLDSTTTQLSLLTNQRAQFEHAIAALVGVPATDFHIVAETVPLQVPMIPTGVPSDLLQRRPDVAIAERNVAANNAQIGIASATYFPSVPLTGEYGRESTSVGSLFSAPSLAWVLGLSITETIFDAGRRSANVAIAEANTGAATANYRQTVLTAIKEVEDGLSELKTLSAASAQATRAVESSQRALDLASTRYSGGLVTYIDVVTAQSLVLTNQRQAAQIRGQQLLAAVFLVKALGGGWQGLNASANPAPAAPAPNAVSSGGAKVSTPAG
jgi:NodT family efflux transporter outer membrane factor (OMF) lipoprotein